MTHALNLTLPIKQDPETQAELAQLSKIFATEVQPAIEAALKESRMVHFARVLVIDNRYIQVITEYDGDHQEYAEFFRNKLTPIFAKIFSLAEGSPAVNDPNAFWNFSKDANVRSLGEHTHGGLDMNGQPAGWLFSAYDHREVRDIQDRLELGVDSTVGLNPQP